MSKLRKRFIPNFDSLENRVVPAGNVTVSFSSSLLSITGDNEANGISLTNNLDGSFTLDTTDGDTTFNGGTDPITVTPTSTKPFKVLINMKGGDDTVDIVGGDIFVRANSSVRLGAGNDTLTMDGVRAGDDAKVDGEGGDDIIAVTNGGFDEDARILGGSGLDAITVDNVFFAEEARVDGGSGDDTIDINNGRFYDEDGSVYGGSGIDAMTITASRFAKETRIDAGSGDDTVAIDDTVFGGKSRFEAGSGADLFTLTFTRVDFQSRFNLGSGDDEIQIGAASFFNKEARFDGGSNFDTFTHDGTNTWAKKHHVKSFELFQLGEVTPPGGGLIATDDAAVVAPGGTVIIDVIGNDVSDLGVIDPATVFVIADPTGGTATVDPLTGQITYVNTSNTEGTDTFTYTVSDDLGNSAEATVTVTIETPLTLTANPDTASVVSVGAGGTGSATINVLANDTTPVGTTLNPTSVNVTLQPTNGTVTVNTNGSIVYTLNAGSTATSDTFQYIVSNSASDTSSPGTVTVEISQPLTAVADVGTVDEGGFATINVAANDTTPVGTTLNMGSIIITQQPTNGTVTANADGTVTFLHDGAEVTSDSFQYTIMNSAGTTSAAGTVTVTVNPTNDVPTAVNDTFSVVRGTSQFLSLLTNDLDAEGQLNLGSILIISQPTEGTVTANADGTVTYASNPASVALTDTFTYTVQDQQGLTSNIASVTINLTT